MVSKFIFLFIEDFLKSLKDFLISIAVKQNQLKNIIERVYMNEKDCFIRKKAMQKLCP